MSAFRPNNAVDQSARASSPDLFESHSDAIDSTVRSSINPAVFRGDLEAILPAEPSLPTGERRGEKTTLVPSPHTERIAEKSVLSAIFGFFKTLFYFMTAVIENIQTPPQRKEEQEDDVVFVTAYRENCRTIPFKSEAVIENIPVQTSATDGRAEERENIPVQIPSTDDRAEERDNIPTDTENQAEEPSRAPPLRRLRARRRLHKRRILGDLKFMYAITVRAYESIYRHKDL
ncbi:serine protease 57 [Sarotherodon galilaeus]